MKCIHILCRNAKTVSVEKEATWAKDDGTVKREGTTTGPAAASTPTLTRFAKSRSPPNARATASQRRSIGRSSIQVAASKKRPPVHRLFTPLHGLSTWETPFSNTRMVSIPTGVDPIPTEWAPAAASPFCTSAAVRMRTG